MNQRNLKPLAPLLLVFIVLNAFFLTSKNWLLKKEIDADVLIIGNLLLCIVSVVSYLVAQRSLRSSNPHAFVRSIYGSFIIKFFAIALAAFIYIMLSDKNVNKPALFGCMGLYMIYTFFEVTALLRQLKQKKNA